MAKRLLHSRYTVWFVLVLLALASSACVCWGLGGTLSATETVAPAATATPTPTHSLPTATPTSLQSTATPTSTPTSTSTDTPVPSATRTAPTETPTQAPLTLRDPQPEELTNDFAALLPGTPFTLTYTQDYINQLVAENMGQVQLPVNITNVVVDLVPDQIVLSASVPLGLFSLNVSATGYLAAQDCQFKAEITELLIGGQTAPASLRSQIDPVLQNAILGSQEIPACFTSVVITSDSLTVSGYKE